MITALLNARMDALEKAAARPKTSEPSAGDEKGQGPGSPENSLVISQSLRDSMKKKGW
jgi:replication initiation protein RepC